MKCEKALNNANLTWQGVDDQSLTAPSAAALHGHSASLIQYFEGLPHAACATEAPNTDQSRACGGMDLVAEMVYLRSVERNAEMTPSKSLQLNRDRLREIFARFNVSNPRLFGSVAREEDDERSDIDILVDAGKGVSFFDLADLETELQSVLGFKVDVTTTRGLADDVRKKVEQDLRPLF
jgi:predicted nucleotidyltransferase